jgi:hypothetical protein
LLDGALGAETPGGLVRRGAVDGVAGDVHRRHAVDDPVRHDVSDTAAHQNAQRVHPGCHEVAIQFRRGSQHGSDIGRE